MKPTHLSNMENPRRLQIPNLNRRASVLSCPDFDFGDAACPDFDFGDSNTFRTTLNRQLSISDSNVRNHTTYNTRRPWFSLELLYKTTDTVLVICGVIFIGSSIASIVLWMYGFTRGTILWVAP